MHQSPVEGKKNGDSTMSDDHRRPVVTAADLNTLDDAEILEGYSDGFAGFPCGDNRSRSYWHGWGNGMRDSHRMEPTVESRLLAESVVLERRAKAIETDAVLHGLPAAR
jgi:hypothetical protein